MEETKYANVMLIKKEKRKREPSKLVMINEEELIRQVEIRPLLYDKSLKGYRKSALRDQSWKEIAANLNCTVEECRKRWRSLRDAFSKHYKLFDGAMHSKKKKWLFYDQMYFIAPYLDCANTTMQSTDTVTSLQENSHEAIMELSDRINIEEVVEANYKQDSVASSDDPHNHHNHHHHHHHHHGQETTIIDVNDENQFVARIFATTAEGFDTATTDGTSPGTVTTADVTGATTSVPNSQVAEGTIEHEEKKLQHHHHHLQHQQHQHHQQQTQQQQQQHETQIIDANTGEEFKITSASFDPDERFLLSCVPILKRLPNKKNALARLKIQEILYNIEFDDQ